MFGFFNRPRRPSRRMVLSVRAALTELGIGRDYMIEEFADVVAKEVAARVDGHRAAHQTRQAVLLAANNAEVDRRRAAYQALRGIIAYSEQYAPEQVAAIKSVVAVNGIEL